MTPDEREMLLEMPATVAGSATRSSAELVREAIAEEREACAALCERLRGTGILPVAGALDCARAIRARKDAP